MCAAVVRYDLEYLGLCPCMVDVEIIDAKNDNQSIFVSAGPEACICSSKVGMAVVAGGVWGGGLLHGLSRMAGLKVKPAAPRGPGCGPLQAVCGLARRCGCFGTPLQLA